jgi:hypothetical protein
LSLGGITGKPEITCQGEISSNFGIPAANRVEKEKGERIELLGPDMRHPIALKNLPRLTDSVHRLRVRNLRAIATDP